MQPFSERRRRLLEAIHPGVLVVFAAPTAIRNNDVEHEYRQSSDFFYLTGFDEPESVLVLSSVGEKAFSLFVRPRDPLREIWDGYRAGLEGAVADFGADAAYPMSELEAKLPELVMGAEDLYCSLGRFLEQDQKLLAAVGGARRRGRRGGLYPKRFVDVEGNLHEARLRKGPEEVASMKKAIRITADAHVAAMRAARPGLNECEIDALLRGSFRRAGAERPAYEPIVGSGPNATVLHYRKNNREMQAGELLLIDAGCEYEYYASDVTRTFPVSGRFSREQRDLYEIVLRAADAAIAETKPGSSLQAVHDASVRVVCEGLIELGLIDGPLDVAVSEARHRPYYMHGCSHWLGMDVHDVGAYHAEGKSRPLVPGMVLTVEPGIYVSPSASGAAERYRGIGIRIEDDVRVTEDGRDVMTHEIPRTVDAVEQACQR